MKNIEIAGLAAFPVFIIYLLYKALTHGIFLQSVYLVVKFNLLIFCVIALIFSVNRFYKKNIFNAIRYNTFYCLVLISLIAITVYFQRVTWPLVTKLKSADLREKTVLLQYIEKNTEKNSMLLVIPFGMTDSLTEILTYRPMFLNYEELQLALYEPSVTPLIIERLKLLGFDFIKYTESLKNAGVKQYFNHMYTKKKFKQFINEKNERWRNNLKQIKEICPDLAYILIEKSYLDKRDKPVFTGKDFSLVRREDVFVP